jgi:hypothetical protein
MKNGSHIKALILGPVFVEKQDFRTSNTLNEIILFKENLSEPTLATWVIFKVEFVKTVKCTFVCMDI